MAIKPNPMLLKCVSCRWRKVWSPNSDVIRINELTRHCPQCDSDVELKELPDYLKLFKQWLRS